MSSLLLFVLMLFLMEPAAEVTVVNIETAVFDADLWKECGVFWWNDKRAHQNGNNENPRLMSKKPHVVRIETTKIRSTSTFSLHVSAWRQCTNNKTYARQRCSRQQQVTPAVQVTFIHNQIWTKTLRFIILILNISSVCSYAPTLDTSTLQAKSNYITWRGIRTFKTKNIWQHVML